MENKTLTMKSLRDAVFADSFERDRAGNFVVRRGFYFRNGGTAESFCESVIDQLESAGIKFTVVNFGEHWAPLRGGASTRNSSHWYVTVAAA
jgi:hypothetical protein